MSTPFLKDSKSADAILEESARRLNEAVERRLMANPELRKEIAAAKRGFGKKKRAQGSSVQISDDAPPPGPLWCSELDEPIRYAEAVSAAESAAEQLFRDICKNVDVVQAAQIFRDVAERFVSTKPMTSKQFENEHDRMLLQAYDEYGWPAQRLARHLVKLDNLYSVVVWGKRGGHLGYTAAAIQKRLQRLLKKRGSPPGRPGRPKTKKGA